MAGNSFGNSFRITTCGESHGPAIGVIVDGCPSGFELNVSAIQHELNRRKPGQSRLVTPRKEDDECEILSGVFEGKTTGAPILIIVKNTNIRSKDYDAIKNLFRPGHADFTYFSKYGHRDYRGGGRASARETIARVAAGAIAKQLLACSNISITGGVVQIGSVCALKRDWDFVEQNPIRCTDSDYVTAMEAEIEAAQHARDSIGGVVEVCANGVSSGLGEPAFDKLDAAIASALMSIPAVKGVEIGAGFKAASMRGSSMQDEMFVDGFHSNNHGGILGGISSGAPIVARIAFKPTSSIPQELRTLDKEFKPQTIKTLGRHDPCVAIRGVVVAEAMLALVLIDFMLKDLGDKALRLTYG